MLTLIKAANHEDGALFYVIFEGTVTEAAVISDRVRDGGPSYAVWIQPTRVVPAATDLRATGLLWLVG